MGDRTPGLSWRILTKTPDGHEPAVELYSPERAAADAETRARHRLPARRVPAVAGPSVFDELVVDGFLHLEQMDAGYWWLRAGDARIDLRVGPDGEVTVDVRRGEYGPVLGRTETGPGEEG